MVGLGYPDIVNDFEEMETRIEPMIQFMMKDIMKDPTKWGMTIEEEK